MIENTSNLAALSIIVAAASVVISVVFVIKAVRNGIAPDVLTLTLGIAAYAGGWSLYSAYWAVKRSIESVGAEYLLTYVYTISSWMTTIPLVIIIIGAGMILEPLLAGVYGRNWLVKYIATVVVAYSFIVIIL